MAQNLTAWSTRNRHDAGVWFVGYLPQRGDIVVIAHAIALPIGYTATAGSLIYAGERLVWPSGALLRFFTMSAPTNTVTSWYNHLPLGNPCGQLTG